MSLDGNYAQTVLTTCNVTAGENDVQGDSVSLRLVYWGHTTAAGSGRFDSESLERVPYH